MEVAEQAETGQRRRAGGLLWQRNFRLLWTGETISGTGSSMAVIGVPLLAVAVLHASTLAVSALTAAAYLPWLLVGLPAGAWVDRMAPRPLMVGCDVISAVAFASLPVAAWLGVLTMAQVLLVAMLAGAASVFFSTAYTVYLPDLVAAGDLMEGNAKLQGSVSVSSICGRSLAGLAAQALGYATALLFNAGSFLVSAACLLSIRAAGPPQEPAPRSTIRAEISAGTRLIWQDPLLRLTVLFATMVNLAYAGTTALNVLFLYRVVGFSPAAVGLLMTGTGAGGIVGALGARRLAERIGTARTLLASTLGAGLFGLLIPLTAAGPRAALFVVGSAVVGAGITGGNIVLASFRQAYVPPRLLGRVTATQRFVGYGVIPLGSLAAGALGTALGVRDALWICYVYFAACGLLSLMPAIQANRDLPTAPLNSQ
jgi:predicted MFS family arabinose efflux permease